MRPASSSLHSKKPLLVRIQHRMLSPVLHKHNTGTTSAQHRHNIGTTPAQHRHTPHSSFWRTEKMSSQKKTFLLLDGDFWCSFIRKEEEEKTFSSQRRRFWPEKNCASWKKWTGEVKKVQLAPWLFSWWWFLVSSMLILSWRSSQSLYRKCLEEML